MDDRISDHLNDDVSAESEVVPDSGGIADEDTTLADPGGVALTRMPSIDPHEPRDTSEDDGDGIA